MGLLDDLLGGRKKELSPLLDLLKDTAQKVVSAAEAAEKAEAAQQPKPQAAPAVRSEPVAGPSGFSWGPNMPEEENQFNSGLGYQQYFDRIFRAEFPDCRIDCQSLRGAKAARRLRGGGRALSALLL